jgi:hypothetical protein
MSREYGVDEINQLREKLKKAETDNKKFKGTEMLLLVGENQELNNKYVAEVKKLKGKFCRVIKSR